jgi:molybdopterin-containing oxidoreductase family iron-sulfur binding subunit
MDRRTFLKIVGMGSVSLAAGCSPPEKKLFSLVQAPDDMVTGTANWYASTCRECPAGCGILAKNREGRIIKVEGNPLHPVNRGKLCIRGQASLQGIYNPDRITKPFLKEKNEWKAISFSEAQALLQTKADSASKAGKGRIAMLSEIVGETLLKLFTETLEQWKSPEPLLFEPFAYESLKTANEKVFAVKGLVSYRLEAADLLVSFGADFLETWLSPVEYARKFKQMHAFNNGKKGVFFHIGPYQSLTCANADQWLACKPGSEAMVALGLIRETLKLGRLSRLPRTLRHELEKAAAFYTKEKVAEISGISPILYEKLTHRLARSKKPLILGTGTGATGPNALQTQIAVNYLNLILDPGLSLFNFDERHRVELAANRAQVLEFFQTLDKNPVELLFLNNVNPLYGWPPGSGIKEALQRENLFMVSFSSFMDETTQLADLILPVRMPLETWDEYSGKNGIVSSLQPAMGRLTKAPYLGDVFLRVALGRDGPVDNFKTYLVSGLVAKGRIKDEMGWLHTIQKGGIFEKPGKARKKKRFKAKIAKPFLGKLSDPLPSGPVFIASPSIRFFDGRGANKSWLGEIPDPLTKVAWQTPVMVHPQILKKMGLVQGDIIKIESKWGSLQAPIYETDNIHPETVVMGIGQGHDGYGRYANGMGINPFRLLSPKGEEISGGPLFGVGPVAIQKTGRLMKLAHTDGSRFAHGRKIALSVNLKDLQSVNKREASKDEQGLSMYEFPFALPTEEGYDPKRDFYPPHKHEDYRWAMVVDLDKCIGCAACTVACYAENNVGVVGLKRVVEQREMAWLWIERYHDPNQMEKIIFLPLLCQHCENAPCEPVCPVFAAHHSNEGLNNQIYNRCVGTRFCSQNCPYKARRFNWFDWDRPRPLNLQLNPDVTVRSKGVMEKCSFCNQRIKEAHDNAKNDDRKIREGEIQPACLQTCPTGAFVFGNIMDKKSRVRQMVEDKRRYQIMGYMNTKPAVIYLKKVTQDV